MINITKWSHIKHVAVAMMLFAGLMSVVVAGPANLQKTFNEAKAAFAAGEYEKAAVGFRKVLRYQPSFVYARKYLTQAEELIKKGKPAASLEGKLAQLQVDSVEFAATDLATVLTFLSQKSAELSGGKVVANFIYKGLAEDKKTKTVTLKLSNVPMTEVIRYVGQLTSTRFKYEEFAVVGTPMTVVAKEEANAQALEESKAASKLKFDSQPKDPFAK